MAKKISELPTVTTLAGSDKIPTVASGVTSAITYTNLKNLIVAAQAAPTTTSVAEGTNLYFTEARVLNTDLAGITIADGTVSSVDTILGAVGKLAYKAANPAYPVSSVNGQTGVVLLNTSHVGESGNLYYTDARVRTASLAGLSIADGTISSSDSVLSAFGKLAYKVTNAVTGVSSVNSQTGGVVLNTSHIAESGNLYFSDTRVRGAALTGLSVADGTISATDSVLSAIGKLTYKVTNLPAGGVTSVNSQTGAVTLNSSHITENGNLYFTNARAIAAPITGFTSTNSTVTAADSIVSALGKIHYMAANAGGNASIDWTVPGQIGASTPNTGSFTTLTATTISGNGAGITNIPYPVTSVNTQTGAIVLNSSHIAESGNLYHTVARVRATTLSGLSIANGTIADTDTILSAIGKLTYKVNNLPADTVTSVNTLTGAVVLNTSHIGESGNLYFSESRARNTLLAGFTAADGTVTSADSILTALQKTYYKAANPPAQAVSSVNTQTGAVVLNTSHVAESGSLYHTDARVRSTALTGLSVADGTVTATDSVLSALGKLTYKANNPPAGGVTSVNGDTGVVVLNTGDIAESGNLYYTDARAIAAPVTGFTSTNATVTAADSIVAALGKIHYMAANAGGNASIDWGVPGQIGSTTPNSGAFTTLTASGNVDFAGHSAFGNLGVIDQQQTYPAWAIKSALTVSESVTGTVAERRRAVVADLILTPTSDPADDITAFDSRVLITTGSTTSYTNSVLGGYSEVANEGSGNLQYTAAHNMKLYHIGAGTIDTGEGNFASLENLEAGTVTFGRAISTFIGSYGGGHIEHAAQIYLNDVENTNGSTINNLIGIVINDHSGIGTTKSVNIESRGANSQNTFEGSILIGANNYANFGTVYGTTGYGFRDNTGTMQYKNSAGAWTNFNTVASVNSQTGAVVLNTSHIAESGSLYYTNARGIGSTLTGFASADGTVTATDTILTAFNKTYFKANAANTGLATHTANTSNPHSVTKAQVGLANVDNTSDANKPVSSATQTALNLKANLASPTFTGTVSGITKAMVGLANVDNTSDASKPVSTATQTALNLKTDNTVFTAHTGDTANPHLVTKAQVGLANVDNTSDANKPISTATQTALDGKASTTHTHNYATGFSTLTDGATVTWALDSTKAANQAVLTLGGARTLAFTGLVAGISGTVIVKQDATGGRTLALPATSKVVENGGGAITLSTAPNAVDILSFIYDGSNIYWSYGRNFS